MEMTLDDCWRNRQGSFSWAGPRPKLSKFVLVESRVKHVWSDMVRIWNRRAAEAVLFLCPGESWRLPVGRAACPRRPASIPAGVKIEGPAENKHVIARPSGRGNLPVLRSDSHDLAGDRSRKMKKGISPETPQHDYHITEPHFVSIILWWKVCDSPFSTIFAEVI